MLHKQPRVAHYTKRLVGEPFREPILDQRLRTPYPRCIDQEPFVRGLLDRL